MTAHTTDPALTDPTTSDGRAGAAATADRRRVLRVAAATAAGAIGAAALADRASAATGNPVLLGSANTADATTSIENTTARASGSDPGPVGLAIETDGAQLRLIGNDVSDFPTGSYPAGSFVYHGLNGLELWLPDESPGTAKPVKLAKPGMSGAFGLLPSPERAYDSRPSQPPTGAGVVKGVLVAGAAPREVSVVVDGVEENIDGVMINLTVTATTGAGYLAVYSADLDDPPSTSSVNWSASGQTVANMAVSAVSGGAVKVSCGGSGSAHFIIDVLGTYG